MVDQRWRSGGVTVDAFLYRADNENNFIDDLSSDLIEGSVSWNQDRDAGVKMTSELRVGNRGQIQPFQDWLAPVLRLTWDDGVVEEQQFGLHLAGIPEDEVDGDWAESTIKGYDPTYRLWNTLIRDTLNVSAATNRISFLEAQFTSAGITRFSFPASSATFDLDRSWWPRTRLYDVASETLKPMGWYLPYPDMGGYVRSRPYIDLANESPVLSLTRDDPLEAVSVVPTTTTLANIVIVKKHGVADEAPLIGYAENDDPDSDLSTANREPVVREIVVNDIATQQDADRIALEYLNEGSSYYRVVSMELAPGVWMGPYQVIDLRYDSDEWGCLCGRYRLREWQVPMGFEGNVEIEMNRVVEFLHE